MIGRNAELEITTDYLSSWNISLSLALLFSLALSSSPLLYIVSTSALWGTIKDGTQEGESKGHLPDKMLSRVHLKHLEPGCHFSIVSP